MTKPSKHIHKPFCPTDGCPDWQPRSDMLTAITHEIQVLQRKKQALMRMTNEQVRDALRAGLLLPGAP